mmetsp:Transcript_36221/g.73962  ORF Transcript_36221/g.73962 Transcript_36221/m.73962 type:complete len:85 (+) Transcript_36221:165-419(+)
MKSYISWSAMSFANIPAVNLVLLLRNPTNVEIFLTFYLDRNEKREGSSLFLCPLQKVFHPKLIMGQPQSHIKTHLPDSSHLIYS